MAKNEVPLGAKNSAVKGAGLPMVPLWMEPSFHHSDVAGTVGWTYLRGKVSGFPEGSTCCLSQ